MSSHMGIGITLAFGAALATQAAAGTFFRLEVGPPAAAGFDTKAKNVKKVVLAVRPLLCDDPDSVTITGTAEGVVNGRRQSIELKLVPMPTAGVHAVPREWPDGGQWVLHLSGSCPSPKAAASTIVPVAGNAFTREKTQVLREPATQAQIEAALRALGS
jgi:hypothetical protein